MKAIAPSILLIILMLLGTVSSRSQAPLAGHVTAVVDGKTFVMETRNGRVTGTIQYIDVPEPEQPLSRIVREHFQRLVVGKDVVFFPGAFSPAALVGKLYLGKLDVGQQLIRDGAAWHVPVERSGQNFDDARAYVGLQTLAQAERRGIWSITNLTPAWEFRALKDRSFQDASFAQTAISSATLEDVRNYKPLKADLDMWAEVGGDPFLQRNPTGQLFWGYDPETMVRNTSTSSIAQVLVSEKKAIEVEVRTVYFQGEIKPKSPSVAFVMSVLAISREHSLTKQNTLSFEIDGSRIDVGSGQCFWKENPLHVQEMVQYRISRSDLARIADAKKIAVRLGPYAGTVSTDLQRTIGELIKAAG